MSTRTLNDVFAGLPADERKQVEHLRRMMAEADYIPTPPEERREHLRNLRNAMASSAIEDSPYPDVERVMHFEAVQRGCPPDLAGDLICRALGLFCNGS